MNSASVQLFSLYPRYLSQLPPCLLSFLALVEDLSVCVLEYIDHWKSQIHHMEGHPLLQTNRQEDEYSLSSKQASSSSIHFKLILQQYSLMPVYGQSL